MFNHKTNILQSSIKDKSVQVKFLTDGIFIDKLLEQATFWIQINIIIENCDFDLYILQDNVLYCWLVFILDLVATRLRIKSMLVVSRPGQRQGLLYKHQE